MYLPNQNEYEEYSLYEDLINILYNYLYKFLL
jgi:hypothetical protein